MTDRGTSTASSSSIKEAAVAAFKAGLRGQLLRPGDDGYDGARKIWNGMGEVLELLDNETGMHSLAWSPNPSSPVAAGGKRRHPRALENTGIGADEPEA